MAPYGIAAASAGELVEYLAVGVYCPPSDPRAGNPDWPWRPRSCRWRIVIPPKIPEDSPSCYHSSMRNLAVLFIHFIAVLARLLGPGGAETYHCSASALGSAIDLCSRLCPLPECDGSQDRDSAIGSAALSAPTS